jgi:aconitate hydratase
MDTISITGTDFEAVDLSGPLGAAFKTLPLSLRVLAENALRHDQDGDAAGRVAARSGDAVAFRPSRLLVHDMLGLPLLVDMMAMQTMIAKAGGDPERIDMTLPVDLIVDHAMTIAHWAEPSAFLKNEAREFEINHERFAFLKACEQRFPSLRIIPPGGGIMHQVNVEYLAKVVREDAAWPGLLTPDTCLGTDSHTPMVNGVGVLGWGIGGLEAEAIMLGEATAVNVPRVVGLEITGAPSDAVTATDIALTAAEKLRAVGVVDCFVELFGQSYARLSVPDRNTVANMAPEYGATSVFCAVDDNTLHYLKTTGRTADHVRLVEACTRSQGLWAAADDRAVEFDEVVHIDLGRLGRSVAGPSKPEQRIDLADVASRMAFEGEEASRRRVPVEGRGHDIGDGDVILAAITSCTNTANTRNMFLAGLLARNAVARGMTVGPQVKTSLAPGSRVTAKYLEASGLLAPLEALGFHIAAFSCSTCNGMSGPLAPEIEAAIRANDIKGVAVLSGNRNFPGRIHPLASRNMIASPPLVVAYALAGTILKDVTADPLGTDAEGNPVTLEDLWPDEEEVAALMDACITPEDYRTNYDRITSVNPHWNELAVVADAYQWPPSTYVTFPPYVDTVQASVPEPAPLTGLRPLAILGDSVTTDHISPSGTILNESAAGRFLTERGVAPDDFNSFGTRRGSSDIVVRSTFANVRLRNEMTPDREGPWARIEPDGREVSMFEAIEEYRSRGQELVVIGGRDYGCGSSRDTAAKAVWLAGVRAVVAESFERIHRSNLVNMGIAPLCFPKGVTRLTLGLDGTEVFDVDFDAGLASAVLTVHRKDGASQKVPLDLRLYNDAERATFCHGGLLPRAFREMLSAA